jgi:hypothetical protein
MEHDFILINSEDQIYVTQYDIYLIDDNPWYTINNRVPRHLFGGSI